jgi:hypothetical protein
LFAPEVAVLGERRLRPPARAAPRPDGQWEVVDRQTGTAPVGGKVMPVRYAAFGYAAWLNRADQAGELGPDYHPTKPPQAQQYPEGAIGTDIGRIWAWRTTRRRTL